MWETLYGLVFLQALAHLKDAKLGALHAAIQRLHAKVNRGKMRQAQLLNNVKEVVSVRDRLLQQITKSCHQAQVIPYAHAKISFSFAPCSCVTSLKHA